MLTIAGGIILAVLFFVALPYLLFGAHLFVRHVVPWLVALAIIGWFLFQFFRTEGRAPEADAREYGAVEVVGLLVLGLVVAWGAVFLLERYHSKR